MGSKRKKKLDILPQHVKLRMTAPDKNGVIKELLDVLSSKGLLTDQKAAEQIIFERETSMSTGMENGVAIPHGKTDTVDSLLVAVGLHAEGVDFDAVDGQLSRIFILTLSPASKSGPHIRFLAQVSRLLRKPEIRSRLLAAQSKEEVIAILAQ